MLSHVDTKSSSHMEPSDTKSSSRTQHPIFLRLALAWSVLTPFCSACSGQLGLGLTSTADGRMVVFLGPAVLLGHSWSRTSGPRLTCALSILSNQRQSRRARHIRIMLGPEGSIAQGNRTKSLISICYPKTAQALPSTPLSAVGLNASVPSLQEAVIFMARCVGFPM